MADRETNEADRAGKLARLKENARLRRRAAALAADMGEFQEERDARRANGAVDPAHLLLVGASSNNR